MLDPVFQKVFPWKHLQKRIHWASIEHRVARDARAVLFTCREEARKAAKSFRPYHATPGIAPCCVASPPPESREASDMFCHTWPETRGKRVLLFLGRIHRKKGCDLLIEAFGQIASRDALLHLVMAGPPEPPQWVDQLKLRAQALGVESRITWPGMLSGNAKWAAFRMAEAFILPSYQENFGIAVVEALACGTPVLISKGVDIWPEIVEAKAGLVGDVGLAGTLDFLGRWLSMDKNERDTMRRAAADCFRKRFQGEAAAARLIEVLSAGVGSRPAAMR
jgi:glycosyltransferase involved in cell wall biosynthesis